MQFALKTGVIAWLLFFGGAGELRAQISDSDASAQWIAGRIVADAGGSMAQYLPYSRKLSKTLGMLSATQQEKVFGFMPPATGSGSSATGGSNSAGGSGGANGNNVTGGGNTYGSAADAIADPNLQSLDLLSYLLDQFPLSSADLNAVMDRVPPMDGDHLKDLIILHGPHSVGFLVSSLSNSKTNLSSSDLKEILIASSPVNAVVLKKVAVTTKMNALDKAAVLAAQ